MEQTQVERLTKVIEASGYSVRAFSKELELSSPQRIYNVLKNKNKLSKDLAERISKRFSVSSTWLLSGNTNIGDMLNIPPDDSYKQRQNTDVTFLMDIIEGYKRREEQLIEENKFLRDQINRMQND